MLALKSRVKLVVFRRAIIIPGPGNFLADYTGRVPMHEYAKLGIAQPLCPRIEFRRCFLVRIEICRSWRIISQGANRGLEYQHRANNPKVYFFHVAILALYALSVYCEIW